MGNARNREQLLMTDYHIPLWAEREHKRQMRIVKINVALGLVLIVVFVGWL